MFGILAKFTIVHWEVGDTGQNKTSSRNGIFPSELRLSEPRLAPLDDARGRHPAASPHRLAGDGEPGHCPPPRYAPRRRLRPSCAPASSRASARKSKAARTPLSSLRQGPGMDLADRLFGPLRSGETAMQAAHAAVRGGVTVVSYPRFASVDYGPVRITSVFTF
jgi:hypothetical protein